MCWGVRGKVWECGEDKRCGGVKKCERMRGRVYGMRVEGVGKCVGWGVGR